MVRVGTILCLIFMLFPFFGKGNASLQEKEGGEILSGVDTNLLSHVGQEEKKIIAGAEKKYVALTQELPIGDQKHGLKAKGLKPNNVQLLIFSLSLMLCLMTFVALFVYFNSKQKNKANRILNEKNKQVEKQNIGISLQRDKLQAANRELTELLGFREKMTGMIVHDLRNPLNNILNSHNVDNEYFRERMIKQSGFDMLNLIQNILDVYKLGEAKIKIDKEKVNISQVLNESIRELFLYISEKNLKINCPEKELPTIYADRALIKRVFSNLLSNAVKYSPNNSKVSIDSKNINQTCIRFSIHNLGPAIPKEEQTHIFQSFNQYKSRDMGIAASIGLGLSFCKMAVELHDGEIGVASDESGTEFWFCLPNTMPAGIIA